ncbi:Vacuolar fusion protein CCZ1 A [Glycine soja]
MHIYNDDHMSVHELFEEILKKDPLRVEAFHDLIMETSKTNNPLKGLLKRVEEANKVCKKQKRDSDVREVYLRRLNCKNNGCVFKFEGIDGIILFFFPDDLHFSKKLFVIGLSEGLITFTRIFSLEVACDVIKVERHSYVFYKAKLDIWIVTV